MSDEDRPLLFDLEDQVDPPTSHVETEPGDVDRKELENSLLRKLDARMSILILIYILNYIDRNNASAARLKGFERDLNLYGTQFASILSILYVGYSTMQIPSNMFLHHVGRPSLYLPSCMIVWGVLSISTGLTTGFFGALCTRFFLGFSEAAFFPGALFLISKWYKRHELSQRTALLTCGSLISNACGSLIASGILDQMEGMMGYAAWRWLFFIEGALTVAVAIAAIFILPDFPETPSRWLTPAEQALAIRRMVEDAGILVKDPDLENPYTGFWLAIKDPKVWWLAATLTSLVLSLSFNAYFPTLMSTSLRYGSTLTLALCAPPWIFAAIVAIILSRHSDHAGERFGHISFSFGLGILGFLLAMSTSNPGLRYVSLFLMAQSYAGFVCFLAWMSGSISQPISKRAVALAFCNMVSSLGNIVGSYAWPLSWGPTYWNSYAICIFAGSLGIAMSWSFRRHLSELNSRAQKTEAERGEGTSYRYML